MNIVALSIDFTDKLYEHYNTYDEVKSFLKDRLKYKNKEQIKQELLVIAQEIHFNAKDSFSVIEEVEQFLDGLNQECFYAEDSVFFYV